MHELVINLTFDTSEAEKYLASVVESLRNGDLSPADLNANEIMDEVLKRICVFEDEHPGPAEEDDTAERQVLH